MNRLGEVLHVSASRKLILRTQINIRPGRQVYDEELNSVGRVVDVFGPTGRPYVSIKATTDELSRYVGRSLYLMKAEAKRNR